MGAVVGVPAKVCIHLGATRVRFCGCFASVGIPVCFWYGLEGEWHAMVMERLGHSLEYLFNASQRVFSLPTVLQLGIQMVRLSNRPTGHRPCHLLSNGIFDNSYISPGVYSGAVASPSPASQVFLLS